jgi:hypothetical protein
MIKSESIAKVSQALVKASNELKNVAKDSINPHFKNRYASLAAVIDATKPVLAKHGLVVTQVGDESMLITLLVHESGEHFGGIMPVVNTKGDAQGFGSGLSYIRRYAYLAILGLAADDDDAESASVPAPKPYTPPQADLKPASKAIEVKDEDYLIPFGKMKGKRLKDVPNYELNSFVKWLTQSSEQDNKPLSKMAQDFIERVKAHVNQDDLPF